MEIILLVVVSVPVFLFGLFVFLKPIQMIEFQKAFYRCINWKMEPIDMAKEIRHTKWMGLFLMVFVVGVWYCYVSNLCGSCCAPWWWL